MVWGHKVFLCGELLLYSLHEQQDKGGIIWVHVSFSPALHGLGMPGENIWGMSSVVSKRTEDVWDFPVKQGRCGASLQMNGSETSWAGWCWRALALQHSCSQTHTAVNFWHTTPSLYKPQDKLLISLICQKLLKMWLVSQSSTRTQEQLHQCVELKILIQGTCHVHFTCGF